MVDPLIGAAAGATAVSGLLGFKGNQSAARAAQQTAEYNARVAENEAEILRRRKVDEERILRVNGERIAAQQRVAAAASGVQMSGSPLQALFDTYQGIENDALRIQYAGDIEQTAKAAEAGLRRAEGSAQSAALKTQAYTTLLGSAAQSATMLS
jgi:hypothetical protein